MTSLPTTTRPQPIPTTARSRLLNVLTRVSLPLLRVSLGVVFLWFGVLKIADATPVGDLVARTLPFIPADWFVPALGAFETILGLALIAGRRMAVVALLMVAHLAGTLLVLITQPEVAFRDGNPLLLTMTGEFVVKNLVLISAGLVLAAAHLTRAGTGASTADNHPTIDSR